MPSLIKRIHTLCNDMSIKLAQPFYQSNKTRAGINSIVFLYT